MPYKIIPVTPFAQNCSVLWCEKTRHAAIVDPGGDPKDIQDFIEANKLDVKMVLLTHGHLDHVGASEIISLRFSAPIIGPGEGDEFWLQQLPMQSQMFGFPRTESFTPSRYLEHGEIIELGELKLEVRHCPGHTPGHMVFIEHDMQLAIVGDVLFHGGVGRSDFPQGDHATLINAIKTQLYSLDESYRFIPGHGPMSTIGYEMKTNPFTR